MSSGLIVISVRLSMSRKLSALKEGGFVVTWRDDSGHDGG